MLYLILPPYLISLLYFTSLILIILTLQVNFCHVQRNFPVIRTTGWVSTTHTSQQDKELDEADVLAQATNHRHHRKIYRRR
ncbi:hypothetical protein BN874_1260002 [Candidatus Contendobacter odensis Run_B_J11]|uniref:Uncharacterized protein n=1 Tax=Candidatus Contendobacter odensis Run_B_J11 TaxID=1400861 RepID=A0A7U7G847_9GAMM|nr:hypothetical protein BN874_1260002 [Candidatus Contendobacter odensis Run_B_J11]